MFIETRPRSDPARWARVHLQADRNTPFESRETGYPLWMPEWMIRRLMRGAGGSRRDG